MERPMDGLAEVERCIAPRLGLDGDVPFMAVVGYHHAGALSHAACLPLLIGAPIVFVERFTVEAVVVACERFRVAALPASPQVFRTLLEARVPPEALRSLRVGTAAGAAAPVELVSEWEGRYGSALRRIYGSAEAGPVCVQTLADGGPSVGLPLEGVTVEIGDDGEVAAGSAAQALRCVLPDEPGAKGLVRTGDRGAWNADGTLTLTGRIRRVINLGGAKVDPVEIERVLAGLAGVVGCSVVGETAPSGHELIAATVTVDDGAVVTRAGVIRHLRAHLAEFKIPRRIRFRRAAEDLLGKDRV
jgi:acyl-CoA synthetase (AMP-forming)/AMP-acid ligase II